MAKRTRTPIEALTDTPAVREAAAALIAAVAEESRGRTLDARSYEKTLKELERRRGRPLVFPLMTAGPGRGVRITLADGTRKLDFASGIGVYGFGHSDPDLLETAVVAAAADTVYQGHLAPGPEYLRLTRALLRHTGPKIKHAWLSVSGAIANENALKMVLQKHAPADQIVVFDGAFAGRTWALSELTDKPAFREGLPLRGNVLHVPFWDPADDAGSTERALAALDRHLARHPGRIAAMLFELIQGEAGIRPAPASFFRPLMERCREAGLAVWVDEVQTFGRTHELFAYRSLELDDLVDLATVGKMLQGSAVVFRRAYNPKPGLVAGTYAGATVGLAVGARIIERMEAEGYLGPEGRITVLEQRVERRFEILRERLPGAVGPNAGTGAMHGFIPFDGSAEVMRDVLHTCFDEGLLVFSAGTNPGRVRMLLPVNVTDEELEAGFTIFEKSLVSVAEARGLSC
ncbi:MAG: aminotransferase class III-fold pyridoxal phosphate-dependent enzyme [Deltaproteobacteria bacterium]|nr:aminotransferase class III-fold pyridoxal phosphate-dependent enzyme [Deltaproteobacteria bacterium]MBW2447559.1 aminotransferase class III-fold pyridoxal phosphate-dependent enzyme [Deltaproteobacteria bacterium]